MKNEDWYNAIEKNDLETLKDIISSKNFNIEARYFSPDYSNQNTPLSWATVCG